jgi:hypothetical protein
MWTQLDLFPELRIRNTVAIVGSSIDQSTLLMLYLSYLGSQPFGSEPLAFSHYAGLGSAILSLESGRDEVRRLMHAELIVDRQPSLESLLMKMAKEVPIDIYPSNREESGLMRQAPGYGTPKLIAKALRRQAMKPIRMKGRR